MKHRLLKIIWSCLLATAVIAPANNAMAASCFDGQQKTDTSGSTSSTYTCACKGWYLSSRTTTGTLCNSENMVTYYYTRDVSSFYASPTDCRVRATTLTQNSYAQVKATGMSACYNPVPGQPWPAAPDACVVTSDNYYRKVEYRPPGLFATVLEDYHWWTTAAPLLCTNGRQYSLTTKQWGKSPWE